MARKELETLPWGAYLCHLLQASAGGKATETTKRTVSGAAADEAGTQRALRSNSIVMPGRERQVQSTKTMKEVGGHVKTSHGYSVETWETKEMENGEIAFMDSVEACGGLQVLNQYYHKHHFAKNIIQVQEGICPKCVYDPNRVEQRDKRFVMDNSGFLFHVLSRENDMDPFYMHGTVMVRARKWQRAS